jgi:hypothetical protein
MWTYHCKSLPVLQRNLSIPSANFQLRINCDERLVHLD